MNIKDMPHVTVEQVLALREAAIKLEQELADLKASLPKVRAQEYNHVGYTNGANIRLLNETGYGAMYSDTKENCIIPIYMLKTHKFRIELTGGDKLEAGDE